MEMSEKLWVLHSNSQANAQSKPWPIVNADAAEAVGKAINVTERPWPKVANGEQTAIARVESNRQIDKQQTEYEIDGAEVVPLKRVDATATTDSQQAPWRWQKGQSGNPNGRRPGSKHKITELARSAFAE